MAYPKGRPKSEESKQKARAAGLAAWDDPKKRLERSIAMTGARNPFYGKTHTPESVEKIVAANAGKTLTDEHKRKVSLSLIGNSRALGNKFNLTDEQRRILSEGKMGEKCHWWKGGITKVNSLIRSSFEYKEWRNAVFKRDNYTCVLCAAKNGDGKAVVLNADHIKSFSQHPDLRFDLSNGRTLCVDCHKKTDTYGKNLVRSMT